jgi:hypothetical protein
MGPSTGKWWLTQGVKNLVNNPDIHEGPGVKVLKILSMGVIIESTD